MLRTRRELSSVVSAGLPQIVAGCGAGFGGNDAMTLDLEDAVYKRAGDVLTESLCRWDSMWTTGSQAKSLRWGMTLLSQRREQVHLAAGETSGGASSEPDCKHDAGENTDGDGDPVPAHE